ncbi:DUF1593-domain-containing protein [Polyplosphaeria fusca]|uniref:DUF1593-domain-containing protein n=1 Tax=Polyplosphaeria fusca TaxID=682080 RepID=A0A9P4QS39_9PLEO|nr:DUF1593-domain-containing protein [Polyplosphaeria fusca]
MRSPGLLIPAFSLLASIQLSFASKCPPWTQNNRVFVLTDISNEPDDTMSLVRLLVHSDLYTIEGLVATTSFWLPNGTDAEQIQSLVDVYATVQANLQSHSNSSFPTAKYLSSKIASGPKVYGTEALKELEAGGSLTSGAQLLIDAVDASPEPLYIQIWGGSNTLASALWYINATRTASAHQAFTSKLRVYSISDQDDTGPWIRRHFPTMRYIASQAGFNQYGVAAWTSISSSTVDVGGPDKAAVSQDWLTANIQIGPLGAKYPDVMYIMEGDTPTLLYNIPNGLGDPEHPNWGSWGGRYTSNPLGSDAQFGDATDTVIGGDGKSYTTNWATIWRWRNAFQSEFAARMQWTLAPNSPNSNATHPPVVIINGACGSKAIEMNVTVGQHITLNASASYSMDAGAKLNFTWFQYKEPSAWQASTSVVPTINITRPGGTDGSLSSFTIPEPNSRSCKAPEKVTEFGQYAEAIKCPVLHVVAAVKDVGARHPITRYRRVLLRVQPYDRE